ncbi:MAG: 4Fe-4S dicluster domain-containing protein [Chloroflexota bacterium]
MEWDSDARAAVERAPFFVRKLVRGKVEAYVAETGGNRVTLAAVQACRGAFLDSAAPPAPSAPAESRPTENTAGTLETSGLTEAELRSLERLTEQKAGIDTRFYSVQACGGAVGCPLTLVDISPIVSHLARQIEASGVPEYLKSAIRGPVLTHHKFRTAVAGCANACCETQIKDFAVVALARPGRTDTLCSDCGACLDACREEAITLDDGPHFDSEKCLNCGRCAAACPGECITTVERGFAVEVGGRLGRHPQLATRMLSMVDESEVYRALDACLALYLEHAKGPERLGAVLNRVGIETLRARLQVTSATEPSGL